MNVPGFTCHSRVTESSKGALEHDGNASTSKDTLGKKHDPIVIVVALEKKKRRKLWRDSWVSTFEWAYFDLDQARIFCTICKNDNNTKSEFGKKGSIKIQHNALTEHARSRAHKDSSNVQAMSIEEGMNRLRGTAEKAVVNLFVAAYYIAKSGSSLNSFNLCLNLMHFFECPALGKEMYSSDRACQRFLNYISLTLLKKSIKRVRA